MADLERAKRLEELSVALGKFFVKEGEASGLPATDGILALMNFAADATVQVAAQCEEPGDFVGWAIQTYFKSLKFFASEAKLDVGIIIDQGIENDDDDDDDDKGMVH